MPDNPYLKEAQAVADLTGRYIAASFNRLQRYNKIMQWSERKLLHQLRALDDKEAPLFNMLSLDSPKEHLAGAIVYLEYEQQEIDPLIQELTAHSVDYQSALKNFYTVLIRTADKQDYIRRLT